jgi:hypothetical protein
MGERRNRMKDLTWALPLAATVAVGGCTTPGSAEIVTSTAAEAVPDCVRTLVLDAVEQQRVLTTGTTADIANLQLPGDIIAVNVFRSPDLKIEVSMNTAVTIANLIVGLSYNGIPHELVPVELGISPDVTRDQLTYDFLIEPCTDWPAVVTPDAAPKTA